MQDNYSFYISIATLYLLYELIECEKNEKRKNKKQRVLAQKKARLQQFFTDVSDDSLTQENIAQQLPKEFSREKATVFLIDLIYCDPFAPFDLKFKNNDLDKALLKLAGCINLSGEDVTRIQDSYQQAHRSHWHLQWKLLAFISLFGIVFLITGKGIQFLIRQSIQGIKGGVTAFSPDYGLSGLAGGNLAVFGEEMAGGRWLITDVKKVVDDSNSGFYTPPLLRLLKSSDIKQELIKLQVTFKEVLLDNQQQAQTIIDTLNKQQTKLEGRIEVEKNQNEKRSSRIQEVKNTHRYVEQTLKWMQLIFNKKYSVD